MREPSSSYFFFNDTATTEIYTLSLHDALPISLSFGSLLAEQKHQISELKQQLQLRVDAMADRKSTRLNSSHSQISYAVFCLKKKTNHLRNFKLRTWITCINCSDRPVHDPRRYH